VYKGYGDKRLVCGVAYCLSAVLTVLTLIRVKQQVRIIGPYKLHWLYNRIVLLIDVAL